jgi:hypothetical protein
MKKQHNPSIKAHLLWSALILLSLLVVCAIPFALAQRNATTRTWAKRSVGASAHSTKTSGPAGPAPEIPNSNIGDVAVGVDYDKLYKLNASDGTIIWGPLSRGNCGGLAVDPVDFGVYNAASGICTGGGASAVF